LRRRPDDHRLAQEIEPIKKPQECEAFVIRRGFDGTATVEIPQVTSYV
jgi:hypothetical protein